ncbi:MAG: glycine cleavage system aminomethyltransferase GcvT [Pirellulaceae bacterium]
MVGSADTILTTALKQWHESRNGRMVDFAGWLMPVQYSSIIDEHHATRTAVGIFDVSHMGRFYFHGDDIDGFLDSLTTRRVAGVEQGKIRYSLMTNEQGTILDDVLVYHLAKPDGSSQHMMVVNAGNRLKIHDWITRNIGDRSIQLNDRTLDTAMVAVQGPKACALIADMASINPADLTYYSGAYGTIDGHEVLISRTGYTGEDGCELIMENDVAEKITTMIEDRAKAIGGCAVGLGARDTLRLEAAMPLYGHELSEEINAAQTDLGFAINFKDREFVGKASILAAKKQELPTRVGLVLEGRRAAREDCEIYSGSEKIGFITSGTFAPTLQKAISMGYVVPKFKDDGTKVEVDIRGKRVEAQIVKLPFYTRS